MKALLLIQQGKVQYYSYLSTQANMETCYSSATQLYNLQSWGTSHSEKIRYSEQYSIQRDSPIPHTGIIRLKKKKNAEAERCDGAVPPHVLILQTWILQWMKQA